MYRTPALAFLVALSLGATSGAQRPVRGDLLVAAAASMSGLAPQLATAFHDETGIDLRFNFGGLNTLARQIVEGARVDVFISADDAQMDVVEKAGRLVPATRAVIVSNQLAVVVSRDSSSVQSANDLARPAVRRIGMGDPVAVPAGVYGRRWLERLGLWSSVAAKVIPLPSSPAIVAAVREGRAEAGIVYVTDVRGQGSLRVAYEVPIGEAPPINYPAAAIVGGRIPHARTFLEWLRSASARRVFEAAGFRVASH